MAHKIPGGMIPKRYRQTIFTKVIFPLDFGRKGSITVHGSGNPRSGPCSDTRLAIRGAWGGANVAMSAVFKTTEFHTMKNTINASTSTAKAIKSSKVPTAGKTLILGKSAKSSANMAKETPAPRTRITKIMQCLELLTAPDGATIDELQAATGWQAHSVRGFLAGTVKKKLGLILDAKKAEGHARRYRVVQAGT